MPHIYDNIELRLLETLQGTQGAKVLDRPATVMAIDPSVLDLVIPQMAVRSRVTKDWETKVCRR